MLNTEAWVLHEGPLPAKGAPRAAPHIAEDAFRLEPFDLGELTGDDTLIEPIYGSWEGNLSHAIARDPVDICRQRRESKVVLGNGGIARVLRPGPDTKGLQEGDIVFPIGTHIVDRFGYITHAAAYDAPHTMGLLAKRLKWPGRALLKIPLDAGYSLQQWAAFTLRYPTAWSNHRVAYGAWRLLVSEAQFPEAFPVLAWGGGVSFAQLTLAKLKDRARGILIASSGARCELAARSGLESIDRSSYPDLSFSQARYDADPEYAARYRDSEKRFVQEVMTRTDGLGAAIFIDNIGTPVFRATLKALGREGVVTTCGWKHGMRLEIFRAIECIARHTFIHTHYANRQEIDDAVRFACEHGWMVPQDAIGKIWDWADVGKLAQSHLTGQVESYFPLYRVNPE